MILGFSEDQMDFMVNYDVNDELSLLSAAKLYDEVHVLEVENAAKIKSIQQKMEADRINKEQETLIARLKEETPELKRNDSNSDSNLIFNESHSNILIQFDSIGQDLSNQTSSTPKLRSNGKSPNQPVFQSASPVSTDLERQKANEISSIRSISGSFSLNSFQSSINKLNKISLLEPNSKLTPLNLNLINDEKDYHHFKKNFNYFLNSDKFPLIHFPSTLTSKKHPNKNSINDLEKLLDKNELPLLSGDKELYDQDNVKDKVYKKRKI